MDVPPQAESKFTLPGDFPGGPVVKNLPSNAGDTGSTPGQGTKIPHATEQPSPCATTTEVAHSSGIEPVSPALAGRFSTTVPPGKFQ